MHLYIEPHDGRQPIVQIIEQARRRVDLNVYILSDKRVLAALKKASDRGVKVRIILDRSPHGMGLWQVVDEYKRITDMGIDVHGTPQRFAYDRADYVCNTSMCAIGTADYTAAGFNRNREYIIRFSNPAIVKAAREVFTADWHNKPAGDGPRKYLVLSPGSAWRMVRLIDQPGKLDMEQDDIGKTGPVIRAMARKGRAIRLILPSRARRHDAHEIGALRHAGVRVRYMSGVYMHAKMIAGADRGYIGSINITHTSLYHNREVGITFGGKILSQVRRQFEQDWSAAKP